MFTIAICDDNDVFLNQESEIISKYLDTQNEDYKIIPFRNGIDLINDFSSKSFDLVLLDYDMDGLTGFETAKFIRERDSQISIAFVTVFYEFSREGYKFDAIRYLVKQEPTFKNELIDCIKKGIQIKETRRSNNKVFEFVEKSLALNPENIVYIKSDKHYLNYFILEKNSLNCYKKRGKLSDAINELSNTHLFTVIRTGLLVNMKYIKSFDKKGFVRVFAKENKEFLFSLSDSHFETFVSNYMKYLGEN